MDTMHLYKRLQLRRYHALKTYSVAGNGARSQAFETRVRILMAMQYIGQVSCEKKEQQLVNNNVTKIKRSFTLLAGCSCCLTRCIHRIQMCSCLHE